MSTAICFPHSSHYSVHMVASQRISGHYFGGREPGAKSLANPSFGRQPWSGDSQTHPTSCLSSDYLPLRKPLCPHSYRNGRIHHQLIQLHSFKCLQSACKDIRSMYKDIPMMEGIETFKIISNSSQIQLEKSWILYRTIRIGTIKQYFWVRWGTMDSTSRNCFGNHSSTNLC